MAGFFRTIGNGLGITTPDTAMAGVDTGGLEEQRQQSNEAYQKWLAESNGQLYTAPGATAAETGLAGNVQFRDPGTTERYSASTVNAPAPIDVSLREQSNGVTSKDVAGPEVGAAWSRDTAIDQGRSDQVRTEQMANIGQLEAAAAGKGPSAADAMFANNMGNVTQTQMGMVGQARGTDRAAARREAMLTLGRQGMEAANSAAALKANEQINARGQLTGAMSDTRGTDVGLATNQAGLTQGNNQFNAGAMTDVSKYRAGLAAQVGAQNADRNLGAQEFTAGQQNQRDITGATLRLNAAETNAGNQLQAGTTNAQLQTGAAATNAAARNARDEYRSNLQTSVDTGNINRQQGVNDTNAANKQQTNLANQTASIQGEQVNQEAKQNLRSDALTASGQAINAETNATNAQKDVNIANANNISKANQETADRSSKFAGGLIGAGAAVGAAGLAAGATQKGKDDPNAPKDGGTTPSTTAPGVRPPSGGDNGGTYTPPGGVGAPPNGTDAISSGQTLVPTAPPPPPPPAATAPPGGGLAPPVGLNSSAGRTTSYGAAPAQQQPAATGASGYSAMMSQYGAPPPPPQSDWERYQGAYKPQYQGAVA